jgi:5'-nucleotidase (lipoprotein e(P4) family)
MDRMGSPIMTRTPASVKKSLFAVFLVGMACASPGGRSAPATVAGAAIGDPMPFALRWYRASAEMPGLFLQAYKGATSAVQQLSATQGGAAWGVIMDADETVLDNSMYQQMREGAGYSAKSWEDWVKSRKATALPGSVAFVRRVRELGGKVVIVTNREDNVCNETRENLQAVGLSVDQVLCKPVGITDKNPRFTAVAAGALPSTLPPMKVLMWLGDNIQDFPGLAQAVRLGPPAGYAEFGHSWFLLPNPLYGSWDKNPVP